jgi:hypothetical protein
MREVSTMARGTLLLLCSFERKGGRGGDNNCNWEIIAPFGCYVLWVVARLVNGSGY